MGEFEGAKAVVTGAASGIGLATARRLTQEGARVAVVDMNPSGADVAADIGGIFVHTDVSDAEQVAAAFRHADTEFGRIDIAYMNAGVTTAEADISQLTDDQYRRIMGVNVDGVVFGVRESVRAMQRAGGGMIVATASLAGIIAYGPDPIYCLTKHAVVGLVRGVAPQLKPQGITINAICPGITETPLVGEQAAAMLRDAGFPLIPPEAIANAVVVAITSGTTGGAWVVQPGRDPVRYEFRGVPGPRVEGAEGMVPPGLARR
jgi:NAD(P)-dependent dehydrogenase (short-subunit alcohol dehydrogenase family)